MIGFVKKYLPDKKLLQNFTYITFLQIFLLVAPLITYPYLVRVLGQELYGLVLSAQMFASFASIIIDFGSNRVCVKHVSVNRNDSDKIAEIVNSVISVRCLFFIGFFFLYMAVVLLIPQYRPYYLLFLTAYGLTFNDLLFPQFFFQGIENMKAITIINIMTKLFFIVLIFFVVKTPDDYLFVPLLYSLGYMIGGTYSLYLIYRVRRIRFYIPQYKTLKFYVSDCSPLFVNDLICSIKDKVNYMFVGIFAGMGNVVIYDLASKLHSLLTRPMQILTMVLLPRFAAKRDVKRLKTVLCFSFSITFVLVVITNLILPWIVEFFIHKQIDLVPLRLFLIAPLLVSVSSVISSNLFIAFGYNKYVLYSIIVTTIVYVISFVVLLLSGALNSIYSFIALALISYFTEFVYRLIKAASIWNKC